MSDKKTDVHGLTLRNQLCFPLYACSRETIKLYKPFLSKLDLTYTQYVAMLVVWERQQLTSKELGQELYLDSGTLTPLLKKLESKGLISRKRSEEDERNLLITVTEQGMAMREQALHIPAELSKCVNLSLEEATQLYDLLYKLLRGDH
ncbi:MAG: MarR family transcriptional regulator [Oscillibacter sp.]|nr:MarR family transcriptional regulator [Oscillibacter sp.]